MKKSGFIIILMVCLNIIVTVSFTFAAEGTYVDNGADFIRVNQALDEDHVSDKFQVHFKHQKMASLVCPSGQAEDVLVGNMPYSERDSVKIGSDRFDIPLFKKQATVFLSCKEQEELVWHKYVLSSCKKSEKGCVSGAFPIQKDSSIREPMVIKDGRLYAKVSVSDVNLIFCPDKKPVKILRLTQRDSSLLQVRTVGKDGFGLLFFSKTNRDAPGSIFYPLEYTHLMFEVQCGDDPVKELWVNPIRIPGRMLELK